MASCSANKKLNINVNTCVGHQGIPALLSQEDNMTNILAVSEVDGARPKKKKFSTRYKLLAIAATQMPEVANRPAPMGERLRGQQPWAKQKHLGILNEANSHNRP